MEDQILMTPSDDTNIVQSLVPVRVEILHPSNNWQLTWRLARLRGLGSELCSFLFKLLHLLLPTQDRVHRMAGRIGQSSDLCKLCGVEVETPVHALFYCGHNRVTGHVLLGYAQNVVPSVSPEAALRLQFDLELTEEEEMTSVYILATGLKYIWESRVEKRQVILSKMRSEMEAKVSILRRTRHRNVGETILNIIT